MKYLHICLLALLTAAAATPGTASAISPFKKAFEEKYVKNSGNAQFQDEFRKATCNVCHVKDKKKDVVNEFGFQLASLIEGNAKDRIDAAAKNGAAAKSAEEEKVLKEFRAALEAVQAMKMTSGTTYGEAFLAHRLPSGEGEKSIRQPAP